MTSPADASVAARNPLRTVVVGYGFGGRIFHCPFIAAVPGLELAGIVIRPSAANEPKSAAAHQAWPSVPVLSSVEETLRDPSIDLVVVTTPNSSHVELATAALLAGKHVVVDKPLAPTSAEAYALIDLAARQHRVLAPFHNRRLDSDFLTVRKLVQDNTLGRIVSVRSHYDRFRPLQRPNSWKEVAGPASGVLFDLGPHLLDQPIALFGVPSHITADVRHDRDSSAIDDGFDITLHYEQMAANGELRPLRYTCSASMLAAEPSPRFLVHGTQGSYTKFGLDPQEAALLAGRLPPLLGSPDAWLPEPPAAWGVLTAALQSAEPVKLQRSDYPTVTGDYRQFYANIRDVIHGNSSLLIPAAAAAMTIRLLELALDSSGQQRTLPVALPPNMHA